MTKILFQRKLLIVFASIFLLSGCWDTRAADNVLFINALGIDFQDNQYVIYPQFINFSTFAKQEGPANRAPQPIFIGKGKAKLLDEAAFEFYKTAQQQVSWEHIKTIIFSENVLKNGDIGQIDEFFARFFQFRNTMWTFGTKESVQDVLATGTILNISPLFTVMNIPSETVKNYSIFRPVKFFKFRANFYEPGMTTQIPFLSIAKKEWKADKKNFPLLQYSGSAFVAAGHYKGYLSDKELSGLKWTERGLARAPVILKKDGESVAELILKKPKVKTQAYTKNGEPYFRMKINLEGDIFQIVKYMPSKTFEKIAEETLKKEIVGTYKNGLKKGIDVYHLSQILYRDDVNTWKKYKKNGIVPLSPSSFAVNVNVKILTSGQWKQTNLKKPFTHER
ncbi:Ger(x)C family spore germination protein [Neobacillus pocheonensis]|uniref:Ger(X)C family spore germination protein n=1 Tax=Neobacillus pocheonensis TaxID=363869 RepID=A0ABT0W562_9BACI|nr:Ger(x)C family spore germination protein [Neobacillus pocheonensis]